MPAESSPRNIPAPPPPPTSVVPKPTTKQGKVELTSQAPGDIVALLQEQQKTLQQFIIAQNEKMKAILKEEISAEIAKDVQLRMEDLSQKMDQRINEAVKKLERRIPISEMNYVYS